MTQQNLELLNCEQVAQMLGVKIGTIYSKSLDDKKR